LEFGWKKFRGKELKGESKLTVDASSWYAVKLKELSCSKNTQLPTDPIFAEKMGGKKWIRHKWAART